MNLRLAGQSYTTMVDIFCLCEVESLHIEGQVCLKRLACSGPSHGWVCLTGLYWLGKDSGLGGMIPSCVSQAKQTFGLQWTKGECGLVANGKARNVEQLKRVGNPL